MEHEEPAVAVTKRAQKPLTELACMAKCEELLLQLDSLQKRRVIHWLGERFSSSQAQLHEHDKNLIGHSSTPN